MMDKNEQILTYVLERLSARLSDDGLTLISDPVQHGLRLKITGTGLKAEGTLYYSAKKKRFSFVPIPNGDKKLSEQLADAITEVTGNPNINGSSDKTVNEPQISTAEKNLNCWIGTDEAGKGDIFGPLVIAGFVADKELIPTLAKMGVRDSKELSPSAISNISSQLLKKYPERCSVVEIGPKRYNEMYPDFARKGGINGILGWGHARIIRNLYDGSFNVDAAVIDKFAGENRINIHLSEAKSLKLIMRSKGESNPAVAAAAILARDRFNKALERIGKKIGFTPHAGGGKPAQDDLKKLSKNDKFQLDEFVKMHFTPVKNLNRLF